MITSKQAAERYGNPKLERNMKIWLVPLRICAESCIPGKIYLNKDIIGPLSTALETVEKRGLLDQIKTWDGCFNIRVKNHKTSGSWSLHSWGLAIDINAAWNRYGHPPTLSKELVGCFKEAGFAWGGDWSTPDGMHFELAELP